MRTCVLAFVGLTVFTLLARPLWENQVVVESDLGRAHLPSRYFYQQCLQSGDDFSWCPGQFCGYFIHGEGQGGYDHPWHRALYTFLPLVPALNLEVFLNYPFMLLGTYLFLRRHGLSRAIALFGGLSFTISGYNLPHYPHTNAIAIIAHIPWLLWATDILWKSDQPRHRAGAQLVISMMTASQILLGYPQYLLFSAIAEMLYALVLLTFAGRWSRLGLFFAAKALGIAMGAAQLLPSLEAVLDSPRMMKSLEFSGSFSLNPGNLLQLIVPTAFHERVQTNEYAVYAGAMASLALIWILIRPNSARTPVQRWIWLLVLVALPLALGKYTWLFRHYVRLPILNVFRCPCRYMILVHLAAAAFVALTAAQLDRAQENLSWRRLSWLAALPISSCVIALVGTHWLDSEMEPFINLDRSIWIGVGILSITTVLFALAARGFSLALTLLMVITLADQAAFGFRSINLYRTASLPDYRAQEIQPSDPVTGRVELSDVYGNALNVLDIKLASGYVGLSPMRKLDYATDTVQRIAGTEWRYDGKDWQRIEAPLPRFRMVTQARKSLDPRRDVAADDITNTVLLDRELELPAAQPGTTTVITDRPGNIKVRTHADSRQVLVVSESFHSGWHATIDGQPGEILRAYGDFQAVEVPPGDHRVELRFDPRSVTWGRRFSLIGLIATLSFSLILLKEPRAT